MKIILEVLTGGKAGTRKEYFQNRITIGREERPGRASNDLDFNHSVDTTASRNHCEIRKEGNRYSLTETGAKNRTYVNGKPITKTLLNDGDIIQCGTNGPKIKVAIPSDSSDQIQPRETLHRARKYVGKRTIISLLSKVKEDNEKHVNRKLFPLKTVGVLLLVGLTILAITGILSYRSLKYTDKQIIEALNAAEAGINIEIEKLKSESKDTKGALHFYRLQLEEMKRKLPAMSGVISEARKATVRVVAIFEVVQTGSGKQVLVSETSTPLRKRVQGSGFCVSSRGAIVTNAHIAKPWLYDQKLRNLGLEGRNLIISITFDNDSTAYNAVISGEDIQHDLALLKIDRQDCPYISLESTLPSAGESVAILGFPALMDDAGEKPVSMILAGTIGRVDPDGKIYYGILTHEGNSGGPVINSSGKLLAVHSAGLSMDGRGLLVRQGSEDMIVLSMDKKSGRYTGPTISFSEKDLVANPQETKGLKSITTGISAAVLNAFLQKAL